MAEEMDKKAAKKAEKARKKAEKKAAKNMETDLENTEEEETVHYYLPLQCYRCSLFIADRAKRKAEEAEKPDYI